MTPESNKNISGRKTIKMGDPEIIYSLVYSPAYKYLFTKNWPKAIGISLLYYFKFSRAILALAYWSVIRCKAGSRTLGAIALIALLSCQCGYNSTHLSDVQKPFSLFITPFLLFNMPKEDWYDFLCVDIESKFLLFQSILTLLSGTVHLVMIWIGKRNKSMSKRGNSYLVLFLSKHVKVNEYFICGILEPLLFTGVVLLLWNEFQDTYGAIFLGITTFSEAVQQLLDYINKRQREADASF